MTFNSKCNLVLSEGDRSEKPSGISINALSLSVDWAKLEQN